MRETLQAATPHTELHDTSIRSGQPLRVLIVSALYPKPDNPAYGAFVRAQEDTLRQHGVAVSLLIIRGDSPFSKYAKALRELHSRLATETYDVLHAHYSYPAAIARTQRKVPLVMTLHGSDLLGRIGDDGKTEPISILDRKLAQGLAVVCDAVTVQNQTMARLLPRNDAFIVPMEINLQLFQPMDRIAARQQLGLDPARRYLLFGANPQEARKGFAFAGAVYERLKQRFRDLDWLVIYKEPPERLMLYLNAADALIFPSFQEGSPVLVKQSLACNLPVVATGVGDIPELLGGVAGCAVCPREIDCFVQHLAMVLEQPQRTEGRIVAERFSPGATFTKLMEVYTYAMRRFEQRTKSSKGSTQ